MNFENILQIIIDEIRQMAGSGNAAPELAEKQLDAATKIAGLTLDSLGKLSLLSAVEARADVLLGDRIFFWRNDRRPRFDRKV